jgi:hypothetical protein
MVLAFFEIWSIINLFLGIFTIIVAESHVGFYTWVILFILWCILWWCVIGKKKSDRYGFCVIGTCILVPIHIAIVAYFISFVYESDPSLPSSPLGKSSCSSELYVSTVVYRPNSYYEPVYKQLLTCPYVDGKWSDVTEENPIGYDASEEDPLKPDLTKPCNISVSSCAQLATQNEKDYPDKGRGLAGGYRDGGTVLSLAYCPHIDLGRISSITGKRGVGMGICSVCYLYMKKYYPHIAWPVPEQECIDQLDEDNPNCFICQDPSRQTLIQRWLTVAFSLVSMIWTIAMLLVPVLLFDYDRLDN